MNIAAKRVLLAPAKTPARQRPGTAWHKNALEIARELAGLPTLVTVVASFCTESQEVLDGLLVESHAQRALHPNLLRLAIGTHHQPQHNGALIFGFAGLF